MSSCWLFPRLHAARLACVAASLALASAGCLPAFPAVGGGDAAQGAPVRGTTSLRIGKTIRGDLTGTLTFAGEVQAKGQVMIVPRVSSRLDQLYVDVGARVRQGEPLADLNRAELEAGVLQAQATQAAADARLAQLKAGARPEAVAQAQANARAARARLQALENARGSANPVELQKRVDDARARLAQVEAVGRADTQAAAQADATAAAARTRLDTLLRDPARANDRQAVDAAREEVRKAEEALSAARATTSGGSAALRAAERDLASAEQLLLIAQVSASAFDLDQARALAEAADAQLSLVSAPASPEEVKAAEVAVEQAFAFAELARVRLGDATITAPIAGIVSEISTSVGSTVGPTAPILTIIPPELQVVLQVEEGQAAQVQTGQSVAATVEALPRTVFAGVVKAIAPVLDPRTRTVAIKVEIPDPQARLRPGMFTQLTIQTAQRQNIILVPREAVLRASTPDAPTPSGNSIVNMVFMVIENRVKRQRVMLGASDGRNVEVVQGLDEGMDVVLNPRGDLLDGEAISGG